MGNSLDEIREAARRIIAEREVREAAAQLVAQRQKPATLQEATAPTPMMPPMPTIDLAALNKLAATFAAELAAQLAKAIRSLPPAPAPTINVTVPPRPPASFRIETTPNGDRRIVAEGMNGGEQLSDQS